MGHVPQMEITRCPASQSVEIQAVRLRSARRRFPASRPDRIRRLCRGDHRRERIVERGNSGPGHAARLGEGHDPRDRLRIL